MYDDASNTHIYADYFEGTAASATSADKWRTARTVTIGNKGISIDGTANVSYPLQDVLVRSGNEFNFTADGISEIHFNHRSQTGTNAGTKITKYYFGNGQAGHDTTLYASTFAGNATSATSATFATKWQTARTLTLTGSVTGSVSIDGS